MSLDHVKEVKVTESKYMFKEYFKDNNYARFDTHYYHFSR